MISASTCKKNTLYICFWLNFRSKKLNYKDYQKFLESLATAKKMEVNDIKKKLHAAGPPGTTTKTVCQNLVFNLTLTAAQVFFTATISQYYSKVRFKLSGWLTFFYYWWVPRCLLRSFFTKSELFYFNFMMDDIHETPVVELIGWVEYFFLRISYGSKNILYWLWGKKIFHKNSLIEDVFCLIYWLTLRSIIQKTVLAIWRCLARITQWWIFDMIWKRLFGGFSLWAKNKK